MLQVRYVGIAEAMSVDGRSAVSLTNFDPAHLAFDTFPATWPLALLAIFEGDEVSQPATPGRSFTAEASITGPNGQPVVTLPGAGVTQPAPFPDLPARVLFAVNALVNFSQPGNYRLSMTLNYEGETIAGDRIIYVRRALPRSASPTPPNES